MKVLVQRVARARVVVDGQVAGAIERGLLVFHCVVKGDSEEDLEYVVKKVCQIRIFEDGEGKMNRSVKDVDAAVLAVSQFTLASDCRKGNRPSFDAAEEPERAKSMYGDFIKKLRKEGLVVESGIFGASMEVELVNDGPVTFMIDSKK